MFPFPWKLIRVNWLLWCRYCLALITNYVAFSNQAKWDMLIFFFFVRFCNTQHYCCSQLQSGSRVCLILGTCGSLHHLTFFFFFETAARHWKVFFTFSIAELFHDLLSLSSLLLLLLLHTGVQNHLICVGTNGGLLLMRSYKKKERLEER